MGQVEHPLTDSLRSIGEQLDLLGLPEAISEQVLSLVARHASDVSYATRSAPPSQNLGDIARFFQKRSLERSDVLGREIVCESAWNMLLDLFAAEDEQQRLSVSALTVMSGAPATTALRQIALLGKSGLIERIPDREDHRRSWVTLTGRGRTVMAKLIASALGPIKSPKNDRRTSQSYATSQ